MSRQPQELSFTTHDGVDLFYRCWPALSATPRGAIVLLHRGHEHSERMAHVVDEIDLPDFAVYAWDARGHGRSPGERGYSPSFAASTRDLQTFVDHIARTDGIATQDIAVVAQSVGAVLAATWVHDYAPPIRAQVLASPAFSIKLYVPFARAGLRLMQKLRGNFFVNSYVKPRFLTHDLQRQQTYATDPLISRAISVNILLDLFDAGERIVADARAITVPTQLLISGSDFVVKAAPQHEFFVRLGARVKERHVLPGFFHDTLGERDRAKAIALARSFILRAFDAPEPPQDLTQSDRSGDTRDEADRLASPLPLLSPRGLWWAAYRANLKLGAMLSQGIRTGIDTGFDSGSSLDYVYRNRPEGAGWPGRQIDRVYLDAPGWRGIRQRKEQVEELIRDALARLDAAGAQKHVLDIAAGHGRYVLDALAASAVQPDSIVLRDYSPLNVEAGRRLIAERGLGALARFDEADAFDREAIAATLPAPTLAIVSGLYELFPDNELIRRSLAGLGAAIPAGGYLVYTGQPWHPQLEMIARALTSHRQGQAWVMRRRTQLEMDQLVAGAGFRKVRQLIGDAGIFTVSLAIREARP